MSEYQELITKVRKHLEVYMKQYDASHDFHHLERVLGLSHTIYNILQSQTSSPPLNTAIITLSALLHDVGDHKYLQQGEDSTTMVRDILLKLGADQVLAETVQAIASGVSFSQEIKDPAHVQKLVARYPELAVVQDADRLDAIGAVGIGRFFTYGGANPPKQDGLNPPKRTMDAMMSIIEGRFSNYERLMKTGPGTELARKKMEKMRIFRQWWDEEAKVADVGKSVLGSAVSEPLMDCEEVEASEDSLDQVLLL